MNNNIKLLFISGAGSGRAGWAHQLKQLPFSEAVALPGHPEGAPLPGIAEYVEWLRGYVRREGYRDVVICGHSMGSAVAQLYALSYASELKAIILVGGGARLRVLPERLAAVKGMIGDAVAWGKFLAGEYSGVEPGLRQALVEEGVRIGAGVALNDYLCCDKFDVMSRVPEIRLPALLICGGGDDRTPPKYTRYLADRIPGATQLILDGASHWVHIDKPVEVNAAIQSFLAGLA